MKFQGVRRRIDDREEGIVHIYACGILSRRDTERTEGCLPPATSSAPIPRTTSTNVRSTEVVLESKLLCSLILHTLYSRGYLSKNFPSAGDAGATEAGKGDLRHVPLP